MCNSGSRLLVGVSCNLYLVRVVLVNNPSRFFDVFELYNFNDLSLVQFCCNCFKHFRQCMFLCFLADFIMF